MEDKSDNWANGLSIEVFAEIDDQLKQFMIEYDFYYLWLFVCLLQIHQEDLHQVTEHGCNTHLCY